MKAIINGKIIMGDELVKDKVIIFEDKIIDIIAGSEIYKYPINDFFDAQGNYVSPGFIDIHTHGAWGHDVMDGNYEGLLEISKGFVANGITGFMATTMTMSWYNIKAALMSIEKGMAESSGSKILGCHLEGPFISSKNAGAQDPIFMQDPDFMLLKPFNQVIKIVTVAPELENAQLFISQCRDNNIVTSIGHSQGTYEDALNAINNGVRSITHTFNAMTPLSHREPGIVGAAMCRPEVYCELIADNVHVHPAAQKILLQAKGIDKIILVTDSMRATGLRDGYYELGGQSVLVANKSVRLGNGKLAGSILTIDKALKNFRMNTGINIQDAVKTVTVNPAKLLGMEDCIGYIKIGRDSDITIFDQEFLILHTFVRGNLVYSEDIKGST